MVLPLIVTEPRDPASTNPDRALRLSRRGTLTVWSCFSLIAPAVSGDEKFSLDLCGHDFLLGAGQIDGAPASFSCFLTGAQVHCKAAAKALNRVAIGVAIATLSGLRNRTSGNENQHDRQAQERGRLGRGSHGAISNTVSGHDGKFERTVVLP